jgi:hypothetical protein
MQTGWNGWEADGDGVAGLSVLETLLVDSTEAASVSLWWVGVHGGADAPGGLPRALRDLKRVVGGGVPRVWSLPYVPAWRLGQEPRRANSPKQAGELREQLRAALAERQEGR